MTPEFLRFPDMAGHRAVLSVVLALAVLPLGAMAQPVQLEESDLPEPLQRALQTAFEGLSPAETPLGARRLGQRATGLAETVLNANAYFDPSITSRVEMGPPARPVLSIDPGPLFTVAGLAIDYGGNPPSDDAVLAVEMALTLAPGVAAIPDRVLAQEQIIREALRRSGYPDAEVTGRETVGDREAGTLDIRYRVRTGPPVLLGQVRFENDGEIRPSFLKRFVAFPPGTPYAPGELDTLQRRLTQDRLFRSVQVTLDRDNPRTAPSGAEVRDVTVSLTPRPRNRVAAGVSFATDEGPGIRLGYERRDLSRRADTVRSELVVANLQRALDVTWDRPHEFGFGRDLELSTRLSDDATDAFDRRLAAVSALVEQTLSPNLAYTFGVTGEVFQETVFPDSDADEEVTRDVQSLGVIAGARIDRADDALDPSRGWRANAAVEPTITQGDLETQLVRLSGQVRGYRPLTVDRRVVAALRLRAGSVIGGRFADVPTDKRFFGGGGGSVRGYGFQTIGPENAEGQPVGGQSLLEVSAELRWQMGERFGLVAFLDGGRVTDAPGLALDDMRYGAGIGLRYQTVAGPIRFDIGTPVDPRDGDDPVQVYLSVGQAF